VFVFEKKNRIQNNNYFTYQEKRFQFQLRSGFRSVLAAKWPKFQLHFHNLFRRRHADSPFSGFQKKEAKISDLNI